MECLAHRSAETVLYSDDVSRVQLCFSIHVLPSLNHLPLSSDTYLFAQVEGTAGVPINAFLVRVLIRRTLMTATFVRQPLLQLILHMTW